MSAEGVRQAHRDSEDVQSKAPLRFEPFQIGVGEQPRGSAARVSLELSMENNSCVAASFRVGGAAPIDLYADDPQTALMVPAQELKQTLVFSKPAEDEMAENPAVMGFMGSSSGKLWQGVLIFMYMHFDAGLPLLQDCYKTFYGDGKLKFTKQTLLISQNFCEICVLFLLTKMLRGSMGVCINPQKSLKFAPAGACFGIQAVFGFLAMGELSADCYAMYAQTSIIVLTLAWTIFFRTKISGAAWLSVIMIAIGMIGFNMSDKASTTLGLTYIGLKIACQSFACIYAERFIKTDPEPLYIQMCWMKPVELMTTCVMMFIIPPKAGEPSAIKEILDNGFYHDWNWLVVVIMIFNMGDTFMTATIAKKFDSVVKGVAGVADILYPTQVFAHFINPPVYTQLKVLSGATILCGSLNFVLAKGEMRRSKAREDQIKELQDQLEKAGTRSTLTKRSSC